MKTKYLTPITKHQVPWITKHWLLATLIAFTVLLLAGLALFFFFPVPAI